MLIFFGVFRRLTNFCLKEKAVSGCEAWDVKLTRYGTIGILDKAASLTPSEQTVR